MSSINFSTHKIDFLGKNVFIAATASVFGKVSIGDRSSVWFGAVIRGDTDAISIGEETNIQDLCILHVDKGVPLKVGNRVTVGHAAILHGATIGNDCLIGIRATVLNRAVIGNNCLIGAHSLVTEGMIIPDNSLVLGSPAKIIKSLTTEQLERIKKNAQNYVALSAVYLSAP
ncbi:MAG: gamma carbonic anhydrase family protein [Bacteroidetes bacterium RIFCSPLOWO2_02_FULL_36_8]|nr:MAG: gamma carbonic anhydrase family protein [Bacteroidetes bacterium RIFCSPLOWO2_02_FULL_36_8]OFY70225.1 MAG: gamma carbonic anhydrase family protein [Bacteroidetes bacterium RIFCSPLOWO2_12_FULL_37_12]